MRPSGQTLEQGRTKSSEDARADHSIVWRNAAAVRPTGEEYLKIALVPWRQAAQQDGDPFPPKPPRMRWRTYRNLQDQYEQVAGRWAAALCLSLGLNDSPSKRLQK
jgi:hypothetical protein